MQMPGGRRVILASASPRRKELLRLVIDEFDVIPSDIEEIAHGTPAQQVKKLAYDKAADVAAAYPDALVIGADTLVFLGREPLGKPKDEDDAHRMLKRLAGRTHRVLTGVCVICGDKKLTAAERTHVRFAPLTDAEIEAYIRTSEPMDKAGAYGIQGQFAKHIAGLRGCYFNVVGLPLNLLYNMIKQITT